MEVQGTPIAGLLLLVPSVFRDHRGVFLETWNERRYAALGVRGPFLQDNLSRSARGVVRGLHYQRETPQAKLVQVTRGVAWDVVVDLRRSSETFGKWHATVLSDENRHQLWIPEGLAHGFLAQAELVDLTYKVTAPHVPADERAVLWNDPALGIPWPLEGPPILSAKDAGAPPLAQAQVFA